MADFTPRPTVYKGTKMRSRLEAGFAAWLDRFSMTWAYEPCAFAAEAGQYLPDFRVDDLDIVGVGPRRTYIEVKPEGWLERAPASACSALVNCFRTIWMSEPAALALLVIQGAGCPIVYVSGSDRPSSGRWVCGGDDTIGDRVALAFDAPGPWPDGYWRPSDELVTSIGRHPQDPF